MEFVEAFVVRLVVAQGLFDRAQASAQLVLVASHGLIDKLGELGKVAVHGELRWHGRNADPRVWAQHRAMQG